MASESDGGGTAYVIDSQDLPRAAADRLDRRQEPERTAEVGPGGSRSDPTALFAAG